MCAGSEHVLNHNQVLRLSDPDSERQGLPRLAVRDQPAARRPDQVHTGSTLAPVVRWTRRVWPTAGKFTRVLTRAFSVV